MKRNELEQKITEALDGQLSTEKMKDLESELSDYPELKSAYEELRTGDIFENLNSVFPETRPDPDKLMYLRAHIENPFYQTAYELFKRYFLAATIIITFFATGMQLLTEREAGLADDHIYEWIYDNNLDALEEESQIWMFSELED